MPDGPRLPALLQTLKIIAQPTQFLERCANKFGDCFTLRVLGFNSPPIVFFSNPKAIEAIFNTDADKFELGKITHVFQPLTGSQSLIMQDGKRHQRLRQLLMPPLHGKQLLAYGQTICNLTLKATQNWFPGNFISIRDYTSEIALEVILQVVLGLKENRRYFQLKNLIEPYLESVNQPLNSIQFFLPPLQQNLGNWSPWGKFIQQRQQIDDLIYAEIAERRTKLLGEDVLSLLISARDEAGKGLTNQELRDQLITLLLLGHDTTASALAWTFYWIHRYPKILDQLVEELNSLGENPDPMDIVQLPYLNAVCQETLRIYPIALISQPRVVKESIKIENYQFQPGTILVPCIHLAHHRDQVYPNSKQFNPNRFLKQKFSPYEYLPFGGGSRSCIGMALSLFEMKLILATILLNYQLAFNQAHVVKPVRRGITIVPSGNFRLTVLTGIQTRISTKAVNR
ncbi:cytochrome P450 family protein [Lyngbya aestuarii BL J]|uniref:Cytochrome P450 family protein n=1 Tax=Lyngbya aestuarii BL J TaxID=1348334 RepID=U7QCU5_9CYAN|nr:cytochrome P450 family protein [Lyngbya aestuarii BL J]